MLRNFITTLKCCSHIIHFKIKCFVCSISLIFVILILFLNISVLFSGHRWLPKINKLFFQKQKILPTFHILPRLLDGSPSLGLRKTPYPIFVEMQYQFLSRTSRLPINLPDKPALLFRQNSWWSEACTSHLWLVLSYVHLFNK